MGQSREDIVEEDPHGWYGQGLHMRTLRKGDRWSLSPMGKEMRKRKARRHLPGDCLGHGHGAGHIPGTCNFQELGLSADMQLQYGLIEHVCIAGSLCAWPESTFTGKAIDNLGHPPGLLPSLPRRSGSAETFARKTPKHTDTLKHSSPEAQAIREPQN